MSGPGTMASHYSIGEVLDLLKGEFADITISKIRFLESQGLIEPERTPSGYRKFADADIERLRWILLQQRDHFLPLRVIRDRLGLDALPEDALGDGSPDPMPAEPAVVARPPLVQSRQQEPDPPLPALFAARRSPEILPVSVSRADVLEATGLRAEELAELERLGLVAGRGDGQHRDFDDAEVALCHNAAALLRAGLEVRHLRTYLLSAQREVTLIEGTVGTLRRRRDADAREEAARRVDDMLRHGTELHRLLVERETRRTLG